MKLSKNPIGLLICQRIMKTSARASSWRSLLVIFTCLCVSGDNRISFPLNRKRIDKYVAITVNALYKWRKSMTNWEEMRRNSEITME